MKRLLALLLFLFIFTGSVRERVFAAGERIVDYQVNISIQTDGTIQSRETILYDFDDVVRHGIFRDIPYVRINEEGKKFALAFENITIADEKGAAHRFEETKENSNIHLKIGDPDKTITGMHTYDLAYTVRGALTYFSDHDELYWNAVGTDWQVPTDEALIRVTIPEGAPDGSLRVSCFTGPEDATQSDCTSHTVDLRTVEVSADRPLAPYEGLTVVIGFPKGIVDVLEPVPVDAYKETWWWKILVSLFVVVMIAIALGWYVLAPFYIIYMWYRFGRDPRPAIGEARAWFSPPTGKGGRQLTPGETGTILDEQAGMHEIVATIIDLARRGYLTIEERPAGDFYLHKKNAATVELRPHEETLMTEVFSGKSEVRIKKAAWVGTVAAMKKQLYEAVVGEGFFEQNPEIQRTKYYVLGVVALVTANIPLALVAFIFGTAMPRKTPDGAQAAAVSRSLRNFLTSQEKKLAFQAKEKMLFEKLLPFATAFGVEEIWAKRFAHLRVPAPGWYEGQSAGQFNTYVFTRTLHSSFAGSVAHAATPTSSSSGFSSGFSGGSSGGGGGGGGGGSW